MSVAHIGTTDSLDLTEYLDERDSRVFCGRADLVIDELRQKARSLGMRNMRVKFYNTRVRDNPGIIGIIRVVGEVERQG